MVGTRESLLRLAGRYERLAEERGATQSPEHQPSDPAPESGEYEALNALGSLTKYWVRLAAGELLPALPRGQTWRRITWDGC